MQFLNCYSPNYKIVSDPVAAGIKCVFIGDVESAGNISIRRRRTWRIYGMIILSDLCRQVWNLHIPELWQACVLFWQTVEFTALTHVSAASFTISNLKYCPNVPKVTLARYTPSLNCRALIACSFTGYEQLCHLRRCQ